MSSIEGDSALHRVDHASLTMAAVASLAGGTIHVAATASHSDHHQAVWAFLGVAVLQLVWGGIALVRPQRWVAVVGSLLALGLGASWVLAKVHGIPFVDGLDTKEPAEFADSLCASLALFTFLTSTAALFGQRLRFPRVPSAVTCLAVVAVAVPGSIQAVDHHHDHGANVAVVNGQVTQVSAVVPPHPFDPAEPIDLGGIPGVTPEQQARAENLLAATLVVLPQFADPAYDEAHGFFSIHDGVTGTEHYLNSEYMNDDVVLDPSRPESLVFDTTQTPKKLVAAMFMLKPGDTLDDVPDVGGALTQWHIHNNLCFTTDGHIGGLTNAAGTCDPPLVQGALTPMMHVWIVPNPCGPFASLEGIGAGQVAPGQVRSCDHVHGSSG